MKNEYLIFEGKIEDFIKDNKLSQKDAMSDENIKKLKKILKTEFRKNKGQA